MDIFSYLADNDNVQLVNYHDFVVFLARRYAESTRYNLCSWSSNYWMAYCCWSWKIRHFNGRILTRNDHPSWSLKFYDVCFHLYFPASPYWNSSPTYHYWIGTLQVKSSLMQNSTVKMKVLSSQIVLFKL